MKTRSFATHHADVHIVFEATGGHEKQLLQALQLHSIPCSMTNPRQVRNFAKARGLLARTDAIDAAALADFGDTMNPAPTPSADPKLEELAALIAYRRHLMDTLGREGVGQLTAATILAAMPELGTINRNQAAALAGLAPINRDSGLMRGRRAIYGGRHAAKLALYMAALVASKHNAILSEACGKLVARGKDSGSCRAMRPDNCLS